MNDSNNSNKRVLILFLIVLVTFLSLSAAVAARENIWKRTADTLISIAKLDFLNNDVEKLGAFMRIMVWIVVFTVVWTALRRLGGGAAAGGGTLFAGGASMAIAMVFATVGSIFISPELLIAIGEGYSTVVAAVLIGFLAIGVLVILYSVLPGMGLTGRMLAFTRILFLLLLFYILDNISNWVEGKFTFGGGSGGGGLLLGIYLLPFSENAFKKVKDLSLGKTRRVLATAKKAGFRVRAMFGGNSKK